MKLALYHSSKKTAAQAQEFAMQAEHYLRYYIPDFRITTYPLPPELDDVAWASVSGGKASMNKTKYAELEAHHQGKVDFIHTIGAMNATNLGMADSPGRNGVTKAVGGTPEVLIHEIGHSLGFEHSGMGEDSMGDFTTVMGKDQQHDKARAGFNAPQLEALGLVEVTPNTESEQYLIRPLELPAAACFPNEVQCVKLGKYYLSIRTGYGPQGLHEKWADKLWIHTVETKQEMLGTSYTTNLRNWLSPGESKPLAGLYWSSRTIVYHDWINQSARVSIIKDGKIPDVIERMEGLP